MPFFLLYSCDELLFGVGHDHWPTEKERWWEREKAEYRRENGGACTFGSSYLLMSGYKYQVQLQNIKQL